MKKLICAAALAIASIAAPPANAQSAPAHPPSGYSPGDLRCDPVYQRRTHYEYFAEDAPNCPGLRAPRPLPPQRHHVSNAYWADVCLETDDPDECERRGEPGGESPERRVITLEDICGMGFTAFTDERDVTAECPHEPEEKS